MKTNFKSVLKRHAKMVFDMERSIPLLKAIAKKVRPGDVVVDVGCGLGLLSFAAVQAGAKRVYAIDVDSEALAFAMWQARELGMEKQIVFLEDHSLNVDLMEKADVLIQETVGALAFDENFLLTLLDAKKRFLKPKGRIIPEVLSLIGAPVDKHKKILVPPTVLAKVEMLSIKKEALSITKLWKSPKLFRVKGLLLWPHVVWSKGLITDCSPSKKPTHWKQTLLKLSPGTRRRKVNQLKFILKIKPHPLDPHHYTDITYHLR
ncbi:MAG: 50S ribosomal protein L11 methyltransferase [Deltaproteobacteria bacterium]|nr:50S ribosomal protein L11 methyltransferase [Deltaproteobacteria bacterium]